MLEEKHLNLAKNLTAPIYSYLENHQTIVKSISRRLVEHTTSDYPINNFLLSAKKDFKNLSDLAYFDLNQQLL